MKPIPVDTAPNQIAEVIAWNRGHDFWQIENTYRQHETSAKYNRPSYQNHFICFNRISLYINSGNGIEKSSKQSRKTRN